MIEENVSCWVDYFPNILNGVLSANKTLKIKVMSLQMRGTCTLENAEAVLVKSLIFVLRLDYKRVNAARFLSSSTVLCVFPTCAVEWKSALVLPPIVEYKHRPLHFLTVAVR